MKNVSFISAFIAIFISSFAFGQTTHNGFEAAIKKSQKDGWKFTLAWEKHFQNIAGVEISTDWADALDHRGSILMVSPNRDALILFDVRSNPSESPWNMYMSEDGRDAFSTGMNIQQETYRGTSARAFSIVVFTSSDRPFAYSDYMEDLALAFTTNDSGSYIVMTK